VPDIEKEERGLNPYIFFFGKYFITKTRSAGPTVWVSAPIINYNVSDHLYFLPLACFLTFYNGLRILIKLI